MGDVAIVNSAIAAEPKDYTLTGTQELLLKSVRADIDGSGAGSAFLPALQLLAPDGTVMWQGVTSSTVAAGGSADVSWFPAVGAAAAAASSGVSWAYIDSTEVPVSCPQSATTRIAADSSTFYTNDAATFDAHNSAGGVMGVRILANGHYFLNMTVNLTTNPVAAAKYALVIEGGGEFPDFGWQPASVFAPLANGPVGALSAGGVMAVGGFIAPPTDALVCRFDNLTATGAISVSYTGLVIWQLDTVNQDL